MKVIAERVKGIVAVLSAIIADVSIYFEDDVMTSHEWFLVTMITMGAIGAYVFPNTVEGKNVIESAKRYEVTRRMH